ncbi:hypothetical protein [Actinosynnema sp. NPDC020468]|uniref:NACHT domain-containing protein n=1 Tax=Actinosynnema sp. NPDC020468 TaxID=3154488 RepID=UPI0033C55669
MKTELSFDELCTLLESGSPDSEVIAGLDAVSGALMVLSPMVLGVPTASVFGLIGAKNEIVKAGRKVFTWLGARTADDPLARHDVLLTAYCLSCYTAFFEAVDRMEVDIRADLVPGDRLRLTTEALDTITTGDASALARHSIALPHPNDPVEHNADQLEQLYADLARGLGQLIKGLATWDEADETTRDRISASLAELPDVAKKMYVEQYLALCRKFPEFATWANLQEHALTRTAVREAVAGVHDLTADVRAALDSAASSLESVDVGLASLGTALARIARDGLDDVLDDLGVTYRDSIENPVITDTYVGAEGVDLRYPRKSEIYIPQAFRTLRYGKPGVRLESEEIWGEQEARSDLGRYVLSHLASPYSLETPLIVLGHPGSGKSLLTELLAARLASVEYHPVRVELRDVNPDSDIQGQIQEQIRADTGRDVNWADLSERCDRPPLVILDGYDELLQATGLVFSTYLRQVADFQRRERLLGRPVRVVVTSRVTLIDKAVIPIGATVVRLEEFDIARQAAWVDIWNRVNQPYFRSSGVRPFTLPSEGRIQELAKQPLLLLMLALYDSDGNRLSRDPDIRQTALYHNLLIRFITREHHKGEQGKRFLALPKSEQRKLIDTDLDRLGIAAIGMFNRRALHISKADLNDDIDYFKRASGATPGPGARLGEAELLVGSFFFVHESKSGLRGDDAEIPAAFEFLHNTFGEFLTSDWLLKTVLQETEIPRLMRIQPTLQQSLANRVDLSDRWFASLIATPLFTRPVVLDMLREWTAHRLTELGQDQADFTTDLDTLVYGQLKHVLADSTPPAMLLQGATPFPRSASLHHLATYTLNLVLLRCVLGGPFTVDMERLGSELTAKPWHSLLDLWRAGIGREGLQGLSAILQSTVENGLQLTARETFTAPAAESQLWELYELAKATGDEQLIALSGWAIQDAHPGFPPPPDLRELANLPSIAGSAFHNEIRARAILRERAAHGAYHPLPHWLDTVKETSSIALLRLVNHSPEIDYHTEQYSTVQELNAEFFSMDMEAYKRNLSITVSEGGIDLLILHRSRVAANYILLERHPRFQSNRLVTSRAARLASGQTAAVSNEVLYELIASEMAPSTLRKFLLGEGVDVRTLAERPLDTICELLRVSEHEGTLDWIEAAVEELMDGPLLKTFGALRFLILARHALKHFTADIDHFDLASLTARAITLEGPRMQRAKTEELIKMLAVWLAVNPVEVDISDLTAIAIRMAEDLGDELSVAAAKDLQVLKGRS